MAKRYLFSRRLLQFHISLDCCTPVSILNKLSLTISQYKRTMFSHARPCFFLVFLLYRHASAQSCQVMNNSRNAASNPPNQPNASTTYNFPAVVQSLDPSKNASTAPINSSATQNWQLINSLKHTNLNNATQWDHEVYLDTSSSGTGPSAIPPALSACLFTFQIANTSDGKAPADGDCTATLGQGCVSELINAGRTLYQNISSNPHLDLDEACDLLSRGFDPYRNSCPASEITSFGALGKVHHSLSYEASS